jgi:FlaA1/EpsC-like NDP-sugar epimerase
MFKVIQRCLLLAALVAAAAGSLVLAFLLRFEFGLPEAARLALTRGLWIVVTAKALTFAAFGLHRNHWRSVGLPDLPRILAANLVAAALAASATALMGASFPRSVLVIDAMVCLLATAGLLYSVRLYREVLAANTRPADGSRSILIYGAGAAGLTLVKEIRSNPKLRTRIAGFLDDDPAKRKAVVFGVRVLGAGRDAARLAARFSREGRPISEIIIAMPSASGRQMRAATANCRAAGVPFKTLPSLGEMISGNISRQVREVSVNDLLGRQPVHIDETRIGEAIAGKSVMVTGGCGSIGSELCRQVARFQPRRLVIFDQAESEAFMLALELRSRFPALNLFTEIGDICRARRLEEAVSRHQVDLIFHAAAYKHVPLMEANILEAVENNVIGTCNVAMAAHRLGVRKFVLISSDKAVNPTSIMGATKRAAELLLSAMPLDGTTTSTTFVSVRFGNVLASAGSVIQVFQRQIAAGGPVTVTHPEMRRYFMSIPEAVQLVLQAFTMGNGFDVFVLDMSEPVPIVELARNMIRLAGLVPDEDIEIRYTGLRPGEKLFEELRLDGEDIMPTYHEKIKIFRSHGPGTAYLVRWLVKLRILLNSRNERAVKAHLMELVPEYAAHVNGEALKSRAAS